MQFSSKFTVKVSWLGWCSITLRLSFKTLHSQESSFSPKRRQASLQADRIPCVFRIKERCIIKAMQSSGHLVLNTVTTASLSKNVGQLIWSLILSRPSRLRCVQHLVDSRLHRWGSKELDGWYWQTNCNSRKTFVFAPEVEISRWKRTFIADLKALA